MRTARAVLLLLAVSFFLGETRGQVTFNFDGGPLFSSTPLDQTSDTLTAHFSASGDNYSIQQVGTLGISPAGFSGNCLYPGSVFLSDLRISFSQSLWDISIMYSPDELATDSSCTMRISAYAGPNLIATSTATIDPPGTYPTGTLALSSAQPFDHVVIHYDKPPVTGGDYGVIFLADNLVVTPVPEPVASAAVTLGLTALLGLALRKKSLP